MLLYIIHADGRAQWSRRIEFQEQETASRESSVSFNGKSLPHNGNHDIIIIIIISISITISIIGIFNNNNNINPRLRVEASDRDILSAKWR